MVAVLHLCSQDKKPLLILYLGKKKNPKHWGAGAGANKPENVVLLCSPVWIRECNQSPTRGKLKHFLTLETEILKRGILWLKGGKKVRIPNSAFEFQLLPHSETWPEVCHTVDVLERKKESPIVSRYCSQKIMDPWPHHHFSRGLMPYL